MIWISLWLSACNFLACALLIVTAVLLLIVFMDDRNK